MYAIRLFSIVTAFLMLGCGPGGDPAIRPARRVQADLAVHKAGQCPQLAGKYSGKSENMTLVYDFSQSGQTLVASLTIPELSNTPAIIPVDGMSHKTPLGWASMGCEDGKINSISMAQDQKYKGVFSVNAAGLELQQSAPVKATSQFNKLKD